MSCSRRSVSSSRASIAPSAARALSRLSKLLLSAIAGLVGVSFGHAATGTWTFDSTGTANWSDTTKWSGGTIADGAGFTANLNSNITAARTVTLDSSRTIGAVSIGDSTSTIFAYTLATGSNTLTFDNGSSNATLTQTGTGTGDTVSGKLAIGGNGTLVVGGSSGFGSFTISAGITSALTTGTQTLNINDTAISHTTSFTGVIADGSSGGKIAVTKTGAGVATLSNANTYTGGTTLGAGTLNVNNANAIGTGALTISGGTLNNTTGSAITLATNNAQNWNGSFAFGGTRALNLGTGAVTMGANITVTANGSNALTVGGDISGTGFGLTKAGAGTLILGGTNTYDGGTVINGGVLQFNTAGSIAGSGQNVTVNNGGAAAFGYALDQATLTGRIVAGSAGTVALAADSGNNLDLGATGLTKLSLGAASGTWTYSGSLWAPADGIYRLGGGGGNLVFTPALSGANSLLVGGNNSGGTVTLVNAGTYSGPTTVTGGIGSATVGAVNGASLLQTNVLSGASITPFGTNSSITLNNGALGLGTAGTLTAGNVMNVAGYDVTFSGTNSINLAVGGGSSVTFAANSLIRANNGVLLLNPTSGATLGASEKVTVASGAPVVTNGMVAAYYVNGTTKNFLTYDATDGFKDVVPDKTGTNALPASVAATDNVLINESGNNTTIATFGNLVVNSLRIVNTVNSNGNQVFGTSTDTLTIQSGGLITNWSAGNGNTFTGATFNFGAKEAVVGVFGSSGTITFNNLIIGTGGFTTYGTQSVTIGNLQTTGGVTVAGGSTMLVSGNGFLTINPNNILTVDRGGTYGMNANNRPSQFLGLAGEGSVIWSSAVGGSNSGSNSFTIDGLTGTGTTTFGGVIQDASNYALSITKAGLNTQVFTGANAYSGNTTVNGGTLRLDFAAEGAPTANILNNTANGSALVLGGGKLDIVGAAGATNSQRFNGLTVGAGNSAIALTAGSGGGVPTVTLGGTFTRNTGGTLDVTDATGGNVTTTATTTLTNGVLSASSTNPTAFATVNGTDWATYAGGIKALSSYATGNANYTTTNNVDVTNGDSVSGVTVNSLRFNADTDVLTLAGTNTINTGGILVTAASTAASITGGTLKSGTGNELVIINNGQLTVDSVLANGAAASALTLSGAGTTTLNGNNTFTGSTYINSGTVVAGNTNAFGTAGTVFLNGGTLQSGSALTIGRAVTLSNNSTIGGANDLTLSGAFTNNRNYNTLTVNNSGNTTLSGTVSLGAGNILNIAGSGNLTASGVISTTGGLNYAGTGVMTLSNAASTYTGVTRVSSGTLSVGTLANGGSNSGIGAATNVATNLVLDGGTFRYTGATVSTDRLFSVGGSGGTLDASGSGAVTFSNTGALGFANTPGTRTLTLGGTNAGANTLNSLITDAYGVYATSLTKSGSGQWVLGGVNTYTGATKIDAGTLALATSGAISANSAITVAAGATFDTTAQSYTFSTAKTTTIGVGATGAGLINSAAVTFSSANLGFDFGATSTLLASYTVLVKSGFTGDFNSVVATGTSVSGSFLNAGSGNWTLTAGGYDLTFSQSLGTLTAVVSAVPEPATYAAIFGVLALAGAAWQRRRAVRR
jgi:fibronectin-binding autotransporter adhesin